MRALVLSLLVVPAFATAQVDLTPTLDFPTAGLEILQRAAGPGSQAPPAVAWCVADAYRLVAGQAEAPRIAQAARRAADQWDRVAAQRLASQPPGVLVQPGQEVVVHVRDGVVCRTMARATGPLKG